MSYLSRAPDRQEAFRTLYESTYADLLKFVQRRSDVANAEDVVAEAFLVVWRRFQEAVSEGQFAFWLPGGELTNSSDYDVPVEVTYTDNTREIRFLSL